MTHEPTRSGSPPADAADSPTDAADSPTDAADSPTDAADSPTEADETSLDPAAYDPVAFLEAAVGIPSNEDESAMREHLVATLERHGVEPTVDDVGNVLVTRESEDPGAGPHVVCNTHIDTVPPHVAFERDRDATVEGESGVDVIRGRGSCDAKGPLAALLGAFLNADVKRGRLTLAITPDEETSSTGAATLTGRLPGTADELDGDLFVVGEPTGLDVCTAAKGRFEGTLTLTGENAHAAEFAGVNAVAAAEDALGAIRTFDDDATEHQQLGAPKLTPTVIEGGETTNQIPDRCSIVVDRRSVPPESAEEFREALQSDVRGVTSNDVGVEMAYADSGSPFLEAFATDPTHRLATTLADAVNATRPRDGDGDAPEVGGDGDSPEVGGRDSVSDVDAERGGSTRTFSAATEASYFAPAPTVVFGPGDLADGDGAVAHSEREYVRVREVTWATRAATEALSTLLG